MKLGINKTMLVRKVSFLICSILLGFTSLAQRKELKEYCQNLEKELHKNTSFHMQYTMTIQGSSVQPERSSMVMDLYKSGENGKVVMGNAQEVLQSGKLLVMVNHVQQLIMMKEDTAADLKSQAFLADLNVLVDSAISIESAKSNKVITYQLKFPGNYIYTNLVLKFSEKTKQLVGMYAEFNPAYPEPYFSMQIDYTLWDFNWKAESGFPMVEKFVKKQGGRYVTQPSWNSYKLYYPEKGKL